MGCSPIKWSLFLLLTLVTAIIAQETGGTNVSFINPSTGLYLDGSEHQVKATKRSEGSATQSWILEAIDFTPGTFHIINKKTKKALDIEGNKIVTSERDYSKKSQKWYINSSGTVVNGGDLTLALEVNSDKQVVVDTEEKGKDSQKFQLYYFVVLN